MKSKFIQIHFLTSYPAALLNRDDAGFAKRIPFGGVTRTRISSQCQKRHWRLFSGDHSLSKLDVPVSIRSRYTFERFIYEPLVKEGVPQKIAQSATQAIIAVILGKSEKKEKMEKAKKLKAQEEVANNPKEEVVELKTRQLTVLGHPEVDYLLTLARELYKANAEPEKFLKILKEKLAKDGEKNLKALRRAAGLDAALFGRMVTSDILSRGDAAVHVAHAFTVHSESSETDYFSAMDDLQKKMEGEGLGSGHINTTELNSGLYYGYVVVDVPLLVSNLEGCLPRDWEKADPTLASCVVQSLIHLIATVSPGAKVGSTAPYGYASMVLTETGNMQPRSFANAFLKPVKETPDLLTNAYEALNQYICDLDAMYGNPPTRRLAAIGITKELENNVEKAKKLTLVDLAKNTSEMS
ncbi:MAG: type I-E CRISPR-associated protein Cas7/Cse4/CasC [Candidatus Riflebacteria bacterium]|nr:type I-E CRISPR-associated protein Cas7/Cse4/CasC [Candidatus Riflebacteria bacterium]